MTKRQSFRLVFGFNIVGLLLFQLFGRDFGVAEQERLAYIQLASVLISFFSVLTSVLHFNELEAGAGPNLARFCLGLPFFLVTIVFRSVTLALLICFLSWWSAILLFLLFFLTLLTSLCAGDTFKRAATYGLWSVLAPVGHARYDLLQRLFVSTENLTAGTL